MPAPPGTPMKPTNGIQNLPRTAGGDIDWEAVNPFSNETLMQLLRKFSNQESLKKKMEQYNKDVKEYQKKLKQYEKDKKEYDKKIQQFYKDHPKLIA
jgi:uncharacterized protein YihD (DUF1040 family)